MKKNTIMYAAAASLLLAGYHLSAQSKGKTTPAPKAKETATAAPAPAAAEPAKKEYPVPSAQQKVYYYAEADNETEDLQTAYLSSDDRSTGFKTKEYFYMTPGEKCPMRIKKKAQLYFLVMFYDARFDPTQNYHLMKMNINAKKQRRECVVNKSSDWTGSSNTKFSYIAYSQKKVVDKTKDDGVVRMFTVENLEPGEYVWTNGWADGDAWFFGVDE
ncbi:MAG: hypothetical protein ACXVPQ_02770 [Bacteroidia bacterium]